MLASCHCRSHAASAGPGRRGGANIGRGGWSRPTGSFFAIGDPTVKGHNSEVILYLWAAGLDGKIGVGPVESDVEASFSGILCNVDSAIAICGPCWGLHTPG